MDDKVPGVGERQSREERARQFYRELKGGDDDMSDEFEAALTNTKDMERG